MTALKIAIEVAEGKQPFYTNDSVVHAYDTDEGMFPAHPARTPAEKDITYTVKPKIDWEAVDAQQMNLCPTCVGHVSR
ncbi:hypothetical protein ACWEHT_11520 [Streptomyces sp. NPDC004646]